MSGPDWDQVSTLFGKALELEGAEREALLDAIDDPEVRLEVESLLSAHGDSGKFDDLRAAMAEATEGAGPGFRPGDEVGRFRVVREIARGGMSTVYLAEDLRHDRRVAIKVLRPELAAYLGAERFLNEMRTMGRLQHPHILPLFDSGETGGLLYYVMPYVEDETLRDRLDRETHLGVEEAVRITREVADALDYAHRNGVLHRDIKPGNILLQEGRPMLADFGIALPLGPAGVQRTTEAGLSLGTPHYMSPEQVTAERELTPRSDVYSLACVLYEMLAGSSPHAGRSPREVMAAIVTEEIEPVTAHRRSVPPNVADATAKALERLPADRFESARDFAEALGDPHFSTGAIAAEAGASRSVRRARWWLPAFAAVAALAAVWGWMRPTHPAGIPVAEFTLGPPFEAMHFRDGLTLSPDGRRLVAQVNDKKGAALYLRTLESRDWRRLAGTEGVSGPVFFSPDGGSIGFHAEGFLRRIPIDGGAAQTIVEAPSYWGGSWGPDGTIVYTSTDATLDAWGRTGLFRVSVNGGRPERITSPDTALHEMTHFSPQRVPGHDVILFTAVTDRLEPSVAALSLESGEATRLAPGLTPHATDDGRIAFVTPDGRVVVQEFDPGSLSLAGVPRTVAEGVTRLGSSALFTMSRDGSFAFLSQPLGSDRLALIDRDGNAQVLYESPVGTRMQAPRFSPSGDRIAFIVNDGSAWQGDVWVYSLEAGTAQRLSFEGPASDPAWTRDGTAIGFSAIVGASDARAGLYLRAADGTGVAERILSSDTDLWQMGFGPDDREIVYYSEGRLYRAARGGTSDPEPLFESEIFMTDPTLSPDGRWLAYTSSESEIAFVYVRSYPELGPAVVVSEVQANSPAWSADGTQLFYWTSGSRTFGSVGGTLVAATVRPDGRRLSVVDREELFWTGPYRPHYSRNYAVHPDGHQFAMIRGTDQLVVWRVNGLAGAR